MRPGLTMIPPLVRFRTVALATTVFGGLVLLASCGADGGTGPDPELGPPFHASISPRDTTLDWLTATRQFSAHVVDRGLRALSVPVTWSTSSSAVAVVSPTGLVTAVGVGTATVTADVGSISASTTLTVRQIPAAITKLQGDGQSGEADSDLPEQLGVELRDAGNQVIPGALVAWAPNDHEGARVWAGLWTDADGRSYATWHLGRTVGAQSASFYADWAETVTFTAYATAPSTAR